MLDFNTAPAASTGSGSNDVIPDKTVAPVIVRYLGQEPTRAGDAMRVQLEFTVLAGTYARRRFWDSLMVAGNGTPGHNKAVEITMRTVRAMLEGCYGIAPTDSSANAQAIRRLTDWSDLDGLEMPVKIKVDNFDPDKPRNKLMAVCTVGSADYTSAQGLGWNPKSKIFTAAQGGPAVDIPFEPAPAAAPAAPAGRPAWG